MAKQRVRALSLSKGTVARFDRLSAHQLDYRKAQNGMLVRW